MPVRVYRKELRERREKRKRLLRLFIFIIAISMPIVSYRYFNSKPTETVLAENDDNDPTITLAPTIAPTATELEANSDVLGQTVDNQLLGTHGTYGIVIKNLKTGESFFENAHQKFLSGSLYKLWVMATVYELIDAGKIHETDVLSSDIATLNKQFALDMDESKDTDGKITFTVKDALTSMITISDNTAALLLTQKIKLPSLINFLRLHGFAESEVSTKNSLPTTTAFDIARFFEKLSKGELASKNATDAMIELLKAQRLNEKIPKYVPDDIDIAHKTGELDDVSHDAGIVYAPNGDYIIVLMSQSDSRDLANERLANVSNAVYNYFTGTAPADSPSPSP